MDFPSKVHKTHIVSLLMPKTITVGSASAKPGELARGAISAGEMRNTAPLDIPVMVVNGEKEGPTILIACGAHPPEISTLEAARRVVREEVKPIKAAEDLSSGSQFRTRWPTRPRRELLPRMGGTSQACTLVTPTAP